jgi:hypothetical protein
LFALFGAVQTPLAALAARLLLNYPAQSDERDSERSGDLCFVKVSTEQTAKYINRLEWRPLLKQSFRPSPLRTDPAE